MGTTIYRNLMLIPGIAGVLIWAGPGGISLSSGGSTFYGDGEMVAFSAVVSVFIILPLLGLNVLLLIVNYFWGFKIRSHKTTITHSLLTILSVVLLFGTNYIIHFIQENFLIILEALFVIFLLSFLLTGKLKNRS